MSDSRERLVKLPYRDHGSMKEEICFYCGSLGEQVDHWPPISRADEFVYKIPYGLRIRCCMVCNHELGNSMQMSLEERKIAATRSGFHVESKRGRLLRHANRAEKEKYDRMERMCRAIAHGKHYAGLVADPINADDLLDELKGKDEER